MRMYVYYVAMQNKTNIQKGNHCFITSIRKYFSHRNKKTQK